MVRTTKTAIETVIETATETAIEIETVRKEATVNKIKGEKRQANKFL